MTTIPLKASDFDGCVFDEDGQPITLKEWSKYSSDPHKYYRESVVNGFTIKTYWTGIDMPPAARIAGKQFNYSRWTPNEPPLIFEGIVYDQDLMPIHRDRYETRDEAYTAHSKLLKEYKGK